MTPDRITDWSIAVMAMSFAIGIVGAVLILLATLFDQLRRQK